MMPTSKTPTPPQLLETLHHIVALYQQQDFVQAQNLLSPALQAYPNHPDVHYLSSLLAGARGDLQTALTDINQAIVLHSKFATFFFQQGEIYSALGQLDPALTAYSQVLVIEDNHAQARLKRAVFYQQKNMPQLALADYQYLLNGDPHNQIALMNAGYALVQLQQNEAAAGYFNLACQADPNNAEAFNNLGMVLANTDQWTQAETALKTALSLDANHPNALFNLGYTYARQGLYEHGLPFLEHAARVQPENQEFLYTLGVAYQYLNRYPEAVTIYDRVIALNPDHGLAYLNKGLMYQEKRDAYTAATCLENAIRLNTRLDLAYHILGEIKMLYFGDIPGAMACYEQSYAIRPEDKTRVSHAIGLPAVIASLETMEACRERYLREVTALQAETLDLPEPNVGYLLYNFLLAYHGKNDIVLQSALATLYAKLPLWQSKPPHAAHAKPRIGVFSQLLQPHHTIGRLFLETIFQINPDQFDVHVFVLGSQPSLTVPPHLHFHPMPPGTLAHYYQIMASYDLDVLFFTDIGMEALSYFLAFNRIASVQCTTFGHPNTTGIPTMDYFISGSRYEVPEAQSHYTEKLVLLDELPFYFKRPMLPENPLTRKDFGFTDTDHLYLCPQSFFKFHPDFDPILDSILRQDDQGKLVIVSSVSSNWQTLLVNRWEKTYPLIAARTVFLPEMNPQTYLQMLAIGDVMLDPLHFVGGNTSLEAFSLGVPIVTMPSQFLRGRLTAGFYWKMGVTDCIVDSAQAYIDLSLKLANDKPYREQTSQKILDANPILYENPDGVRALEAFFLSAIK